MVKSNVKGARRITTFMCKTEHEALEALMKARCHWKIGALHVNGSIVGVTWTVADNT